MLENLTDRLSRVVKTMRGQARLTEANTAEMLREIRLALLEADVALPVVKSLLEQIKFKALGEEVVGSLSPGQALVGVVQRELAQVMMGDTNLSGELNLATQPPAVILMAGLQGAGKTTSVGKLAKWLQEKKKKKVLTVSCDVYRPAAIEQLETVTKQVGAEFFPSDVSQKPNDIALAALDWARRHYFDVVLVDTAGRLGVDEDLMKEAIAIRDAVNPDEILFVVDAMIGQDAVRTAKAFGEGVGFDGVVLTKLDGDARGGAALSIAKQTGKPIFFASTGEKLSDFDVFYPERMASRILGMGDVATLAEQAKKALDTETSKKLEEKFVKGEDFTLEDFLEQLQGIAKMGNMSKILSMMPGAAQMKKQIEAIDDTEITKSTAIVQSMTPAERRDPKILNGSRRARIAKGSGRQVSEVNNLVDRFAKAQKAMKMARNGGSIPGMPAMPAMPGMPAPKQQIVHKKKSKSGNPAKRAAEESR